MDRKLAGSIAALSVMLDAEIDAQFRRDLTRERASQRPPSGKNRDKVKAARKQRQRSRK